MLSTPNVGGASPYKWADFYVKQFEARHARGSHVYSSSQVIEDCGLRLIDPGTWYGEGALAAEIGATVNFGPRLNATRGLAVLLIPRVDHFDTPAYDGLIIDSSGSVVANLNLKTPIEINGTFPRAIRGSLHYGKEMSAIRGWGDQLRARIQQFAKLAADYRWSESKLKSHVAPELTRFEKLARLFVTVPPRPLWIMIDSVTFPNDDTLARLAYRTEGQPHLTILIHHHGRIWRLHMGATQDWDVGDF